MLSNHPHFFFLIYRNYLDYFFSAMQIQPVILSQHSPTPLHSTRPCTSSVITKLNITLPFSARTEFGLKYMRQKSNCPPPPTKPSSGATPKSERIIFTDIVGARQIRKHNTRNPSIRSDRQATSATPSSSYQH